MEIGQVLPAMQRGDGAAGERPEQWEMKLIDMEVQKVELAGPLADAVEHQHIIGDRIAHVGVEPQRLRDAGREGSRRNGVAARKQRDIVAECHQFLC